MSEPTHGSKKPKPEEEEVVQQLRTKEPEAPFGQDEPNPHVVSDATSDEKYPGEDAYPGSSGYGHRDPQTEMPHIPGAPDAGDPPTHDAGTANKKSGGKRSPSK
ncbi:MAG: hypothetical protein ACR2NB_08745 [Solirubrobacteraceae bacterium]